MGSNAEVGPGQVAFRVLASTDPLGLGKLDLCGRVLAVGAGVTHLRPGDIAFGTATLGDASAVVAVDARFLARRPASLTAEEAAALPSWGAMALNALAAAGLAAGERLLVTDASDPVGALAVQIGKAMGANVTAWCRDRDVPRVLDLGADAALATDRSDGGHPSLRGVRTFDVVLAPDASDGVGAGPRRARVEPVALVERAVLEQLARLADEHGCAPLLLGGRRSGP